jgi:hypothetical protein
MRTEANTRTQPDRTDQAPLTPTEYARLEHIAQSIWPDHLAASPPTPTMASWRRHRMMRLRLRQVNKWVGITAVSWFLSSGMLLAFSTRLWRGGEPRLAIIGAAGAIVTIAGVAAWSKSMGLLFALTEARESDPSQE